MFKILKICKGGGYQYCRTEPPHPKMNSNGLYPLHRVILENKLGRLLESNEIAHHIDGNKENNTPENIELKSWSKHSVDHNKERFPKQMLICCVCKRTFITSYRLSNYKTKKTGIYCSRSCASKGSYPKTRKEPNTHYMSCPECKDTFHLNERDYNKRSKNKLGIFCSKSCSSKYTFRYKPLGQRL